MLEQENDKKKEESLKMLLWEHQTIVQTPSYTV